MKLKLKRRQTYDVLLAIPGLIHVRSIHVSFLKPSLV